jgi:ribosomal protein S18 acetylase RimI-like enzyme
MSVRTIQPEDAAELTAFFAGIPEADRNFFKEDVTDPGVVDGWLFDDPRSLRLIYTGDGEQILAVATVAPGVGRSGHVGDLRLVVAADARRAGIGEQLARHALVTALRGDITKLTVEVAAEQQGAIDMFRGLGFTPEALLRGHRRGPEGEMLDIVVLARIAEENWAAMAAAGLSEADQ